MAHSRIADQDIFKKVWRIGDFVRVFKSIWNTFISTTRGFPTLLYYLEQLNSNWKNSNLVTSKHISKVQARAENSLHSSINSIYFRSFEAPLTRMLLVINENKVSCFFRRQLPLISNLTIYLFDRCHHPQIYLYTSTNGSIYSTLLC